MVDMAHDGDNRRARFQRFRGVIDAFQPDLDVGLRHALNRVTKFLDDQFSCVGVERIGGAHQFTLLHHVFHDIGDTLGSYNHPDIAAAILKPFVSEQNHWMVEQHGIFQGYYFFHHLGLDRDMRDRFKDHPHYQYTAEFCHKYDQKAFDRAYDSMPLEAFVPMVEQVFAAPKRSIYLDAIKDG